MRRTLVKLVPLLALIVVVPPAAAAPPGAWTAATAAQARETFERLLALAGTWRGRSTQGWTSEVEIRAIARGSSLLVTSRFVDEPDEGMATVYHLDGDRLVLTHYCEAGNQPRLRLAAIDGAAGAYHFVFDGGANLPSRNVGHMDEALMRLGDEVFHQSWTWHADGTSRWMEDIEYRRVSP